MRKSVIISCGVIAFILLALIIVPKFIDWNKYKPVLAEKIHESTGYALTIDGDLELSVFPWPVFTAKNIAVNSAVTNTTFVKADSLEVSVDLLPLIQKNINVSRIDIVKPTISMIVDENGNKNWIPQKKENAANKKAETAQEQQAQANIALNKVNIKEGLFTYSDIKEKLNYEVSNINTTLSASSINGPFKADGDITYNGQELEFALDTDTIIPGKTGKIEFTMNHDKTDTKLKLVGSLGLKPALSFKGNMTFSAEKASEFIMAIKAPTPLLGAIDDNKLSVQATLNYTPKIFEVSYVSVSNQQTDMYGNIIWTFATDTQKPALSLDMTSNKTTWHDVMTREIAGKKLSSDASSSSDLFASLASYQDKYTKFAESMAKSMIPVDIKLAIKSLSLNGKAASNLTAHIKHEPGVYKIDEFKAVLPESTVLSANGEFVAQSGDFDATITLKSAQTNKLLQSYKLNYTLPSDDLDVKSTVKLSKTALTIPSFIIQNGKAKVGTKIDYQRSQKIPLSITVNSQNLSLDNLMQSSTASGKAASANKSSGASPLPTVALRKFNTAQAQLKLLAQNTIYNGQNIQTVSLDTTLDKLYMNINSFGLAKDDKTKMTASGYIKDASTLEGMDLDVLFQTAKLSSLVPIFNKNYTGNNLNAANLKMSIIGSPKELKIDFGGTVNDTAMRLHGTINNVLRTPDFALKASANHTETSRMIESFLGYKPRGVGIGRFFAETSMNGNAKDITMPDVFIQIGENKIRGDASYKTNGTIKTINARLNGETLDVGELMPETPATKGNTSAAAKPTGKDRWSSEPINLDALKTVEGRISLMAKSIIYGDFTLTNPALDIGFNKGTVTLTNLGTDLFGGTAAITGNLTVGGGKTPHTGAFNIDIKNTDVGKFFQGLGQKTFASGILNYTQKIAFSGLSQKTMVSSLNGTGTMSVTNAVLNGMDLNKLSQNLANPNSLTDFTTLFDTLTQGGTTPFDTVTAPIVIQNGIVASNNIQMKSNEVVLAAAGQANLPDWTINAKGEINFVNRSNIPPLSMTLYGTLDNPQKRFDQDIVSKFIRQKATSAIGKKISESLFGKQKKQPETTTTAPQPQVQTPTAPTVQPVTPQSTGTGTQQQQQPASQQQQQKSPEEQLKDVGQQLLNNFLGGGQ